MPIKIKNPIQVWSKESGLLLEIEVTEKEIIFSNPMTELPSQFYFSVPKSDWWKINALIQNQINDSTLCEYDQ